jgi:nicotinamide riboside kinase
MLIIPEYVQTCNFLWMETKYVLIYENDSIKNVVHAKFYISKWNMHSLKNTIKCIRVDLVMNQVLRCLFVEVKKKML